MLKLSLISANALLIVGSLMFCQGAMHLAQYNPPPDQPTPGRPTTTASVPTLGQFGLEDA